MNVIVPITVTAAMLSGSTSIAEPRSGVETAWSASSVNYVVGDVRIRSTTHRKYRCAVDHTSAASPLPEDDPTRWVDIGPTDLWAPFDIYTSTQVRDVTYLKYVLRPGFFNAMALYGLAGFDYRLVVRDGPGGSIIFEREGFLTADPVGWYEYLFTTPATVSKLVFNDIPLRPDPEVTLEINAATGEPVAIGMIVLGDFTPLITSAPWGGTEYGATAEPITYSYINQREDGTTEIVRRHAATNMRVSVTMPRAYADAAVQIIQRVLDVPVAWIATTAEGYAGLNTFGIGSGSMNYDSFGTAKLSITVKGLI